jgi:hypothetical protein
MTIASPPIMGHVVECNNCHTTAVVLDGQHIHDALRCDCCSGHSSAHADAGSACRPVTVHANAFVSLVDLAALQLAGGPN